MSEALDRIAARVAARAHTAAAPVIEAPVNAPPLENAPPPPEERIADIEASLADVAGRLDAMEQREVETALAEMDVEMGDDGMLAAVPPQFAKGESDGPSAVQRDDGWYAVDADGKDVGGPFASEDEAKAALKPAPANA